MNKAKHDCSSFTPAKRTLPTLILTEQCQPGDEGAFLVADATEQYFVREIHQEDTNTRRDGMPNWAPSRFNVFPIVLDGSGQPWAEACLYLLAGMESNPSIEMSTYDAKALDLAAFRRFIEETKIDWMNFPKNQLFRPTYRYRTHLNLLLRSGELKQKTVARRMSTVIGFYRWLASEEIFKPENPPWKERDIYITSKDYYGFQQSKKIKSTDLIIKAPVQQDTFEETINDGGKLRPLPPKEQEWLLDALAEAGNTEMTLIHLMGLTTGARLQTICTVKIRHIEMPPPANPNDEVRLPVGPGTGIDTKGDKRLVLHIPGWLYQTLQVYANSERASRRRQKANKKDSNQYLFLTKNGAPFYEDRQDRKTFAPTNKRRYYFDGGAVETFIRNIVRPYIEKKYGCKKFNFIFHDTRATFGMNLTDFLLSQVEAGKLNLAYVREYVKTRMGHKSAADTDRYLDFRHKLKFKRAVIEQHEKHLQSLCEKASKAIL